METLKIIFTVMLNITTLIFLPILVWVLILTVAAEVGIKEVWAGLRLPFWNRNTVEYFYPKLKKKWK